MPARRKPDLGLDTGLRQAQPRRVTDLERHGRDPRPSAIPYNPGLYHLVQSKRQWQRGPEQPRLPVGFAGWHQRGYLPHRDEPGLVQFVTFRLADAFPAALRTEWASLLEIEDDHTRARQLEGYLDRGRGESHLRRPEVAKVVSQALWFFHGTRYDLEAWVVMPNHVHVLFTQYAPLGRVVGGWKSYTARQANRLRHRTGQFWAVDYWDTYMRDDAHTTRTRRYIENNPVKAHLVREPAQWPWSSAPWRDDFGRLVLPPR